MRKCRAKWFLVALLALCGAGAAPAYAIQAGITLDVHQDIGPNNPGMWPNDFHIEGLICSHDMAPTVITHLDGPFTNFTYTVTKMNPDDPADCWYWFEATWWNPPGTGYIPYCAVIHLGLLFDVGDANVIIDLVGWWTRDGVPVGHLFGGLRNNGFVPAMGFNVADTTNPQVVTIANGFLQPPNLPPWLPPILPPPPPNPPPWPPADFELTVLQMDVVPFPPGIPPPFEELREDGQQANWPWVPVVHHDGQPISPARPHIMMPDSFFDVFLSGPPTPGGNQFGVMAPFTIEPGGFLVMRQKVGFFNNSTRGYEERWFWEIHGAQGGPAACCFPDGTCQQIPQDVCLQLGGNPLPGINCFPVNPCPQPDRGACCFWENGIQCLITDPLTCQQQLAGQWMGLGTNCDDLNGNGVADVCEQNPELGACCYGQVAVFCVVTDQMTCEQQYFGVWKGPGTTCADLNGNGVADICEQGPGQNDYGDAPEQALAYSTGVVGQFPTCINVGPPGSYIQHGLGWARFGPGWDPEPDGNGGLCPFFAPYDNDECFMDGDAGLIFPPPYTLQGGVEVPCPSSPGGPALGMVCQPAAWGPNIDILVTNNMPVMGFVNVLIDWNRDGQWGGGSQCPMGVAMEHVLVDFPVPMGFSGPLSALGPPGFLIGPNAGYVWARFTITERRINMPGQWDGRGIFEDGETEDYLLKVEGGQPQLFDHGDAPEGALAYPATGIVGQFPTCLTVGPAASFIQHGLGQARFGPAWDAELDGNGGLCPGFNPYDADECMNDGDAGLVVPGGFTIQGPPGGEQVVPCPQSPAAPLGRTCLMAIWGGNVDILVTNNMPSNGFVNVLIDWNQDGVWGGFSTCPGGTATPEHVLVDFPVPMGFNGPLSALGPPNFLIGPNPGYVWSRFTITERPIAPAPGQWDGSGVFEDGETEDYLLRILCKCRADVNGDLMRNGLDVQCFVDCLLGVAIPPCVCECADMNADGVVDLLDVPMFVNSLLNQTGPCP